MAIQIAHQPPPAPLNPSQLVCCGTQCTCKVKGPIPSRVGIRDWD